MEQPDKRGCPVPSSIRLFIALLLIIVVMEFLVMVLLPYLMPGQSPLLQNLTDGLLLAVMSAPFLWRLIARPLRSLALAEASRARALFSHMENAVIGYNLNGEIESMNPAAERLFGYRFDEVRGGKISCFIPDLELLGFYVGPGGEDGEQINSSRMNLETNACHKDGSLLPVAVSVTSLFLEGKKTSIAIIDDITERKRYEEQLEYQANHDDLTGLPNRNLLGDRIRQALLLTGRLQQEVAIFFIDLDNFKYLNDTMGHEVGDRLLKTVAERLQECVRTGDTLARQGGDEFVVVISSSEVSEHASSIAAKILEAVSRPFVIREHEFVISCSIGISVYPRDGGDVEALVKHADIAMYRAKEQGRNCFQFYTAEMNARSLARLAMEKHLRRALDQEEFSLSYQPKVSLETGRIVGMEALARWDNPELGAVSPGSFIPVAEETGLIEPIGEWVLRQACRRNRTWQDAGLPPLTVAVNLSPRQFVQQNIVALVDRILGETGLDPRWLELELTESMVMQDVDRAGEVMNELKQLGVCLTMDDFGTGYSSLSYLKRFPFDKLKIDQSFVRDITSDPDNAAIARAVIALGHSLGLKIIAEGGETQGQFDFMCRNGCDEFQGYFFSRPLAADNFEALLRDDHSLPPQFVSEPGRHRTLLLVDDEAEVLASLRRLFMMANYRVLTATSAAEGFEMLAGNQVTVIIVDQKMPHMTGCEFLSRVRKLYPDTVRIILSGHADLDSVTDAINRGAAYKFLSKPWDETRLLDTIDEAFRSRNFQEAVGG